MPTILASRTRAALAVVLSLSLALTLAIVSTLTPSRMAHASGTLLRQVSADPYTNTSSQHKTEVEPDSFSYGSTVVFTFQVGRFYDGGASNIGWATSADGGKTWHSGFLPGLTVYNGGTFARVSDPAVAYDVFNRTWMISSLVLTDGLGGPTGAGVVVSRSPDGIRWFPPVIVALAGANGFFDKDWIVCDSPDPFHIAVFIGHCYVEWDKFDQGDLVVMSTSTDGGRGWGPALSPAGGGFGLGGQPLVQPSGAVVVPFSENNGDIGAFVSRDGGASWSSVVLAAGVSSAVEGGKLRSSPLPSAEVDARGRVYVVWNDCRFEPSCAANDIVMTTSLDGVHWSAVQRIPIDAVGSGVDHFLPGIGVDKSTFLGGAHIGLVYYYYPMATCTPATCVLDVGFVSSTDGGTHWSAPTPLATGMSTTWLAQTNQGYMVGDYMSTSIVLGKAFPIFAVAGAPNGSVYAEAMFTANGGLPITGGTLAASSLGAYYGRSGTQAAAAVTRS